MNADTVIICPSSFFFFFFFFRVSGFRLPAPFFFLSLVGTALFHISSHFDFDTSGLTVTSFSRLFRVGSRELARVAF